MHRYATGLPVALLAFGLFSGAGMAQETCAIRPLKPDAPPSVEVLNETLACIQRRIEQLEQQAGRGAGIGGGPGPSAAAAPPAGQAFEFNDLRVSMEHATLVNRRSVLLELNIENLGDKPRLVVVEAQVGTVVNIRGVAPAPRVEVQGINVCPMHGAAAPTTAARLCLDVLREEASWTTLEPGRPLTFTVKTQPMTQDIKADTASTTVRILVKDPKGPITKDVSFTRIALEQ